MELTDYAKSRLPDIGKGAIAQQTRQRIDKLIGRPIDASGFTSTEEESSTDDKNTYCIIGNDLVKVPSEYVFEIGWN